MDLAGHHEEFRAVIRGRTSRRCSAICRASSSRARLKGFCAEDPAANPPRYKQFLFYVMLDPELATTPKLEGEVVKRFRAMMPFLSF